MDLKLIKNLLSMIADSDVNEVSIEEGDFKIKVKKQADVTHSQAPMHFTMPQAQGTPAPAPSAPAPASAPAPNQQSSEVPAAPKKSGDEIKSPIVGTFYRSSSPTSDAYVKVGDKVSKGSTLCIIEAMKIMNEIESEVSGTILEILVDDASPVEYDQPLFLIDPS